MQWINTKDGYGWASIALHWLAAIAVFLMLATGFQADFAGDAGDRAARAAAMGWHIGLGGVFFLILLARVLSHYLQTQPAPPKQAPLLMFLASATHHVLLAAILIQIVSGPLAIWSGGRAINVFDLVSIPSPFAERNEGIHELAETLHAVGRWALVGFIGLHIVGALKHLFMDEHGSFRMAAPGKRG
ncbi:MAG: cytochrome b/b6 domain-containing protein [Hyphomonadaceae bacterium]|nr:cytochrome b/b6 domain-containing protein [Hyphomonadaceae bacterium]